MTIRTRGISGLLLAGALPLSLVQPAHAAADAATNAKIEKLESEIHELTGEIQDLKRSTSSQYADAVQQRQPKPDDVKVTLDKGRPTFSTADSRFTASIRGLAQFDAAYYMQDISAKTLPLAYGPDLSSGANFRRVYLGVQGKVFGDWSYNLNFDFGGSNGTEAPGHIQSVYLQYDGLNPFAFRIGAYPPPANLEDSTSASDTMFLERNSPSDLQRNIAGGDGRDAVSLLYTGDRLFGALSFTGGKAQDSAVFDEQQALLGRASYLLYSDSDAHFLVGGNGTYVLKFPDAVANGAPTISNTPGAAALNSIALSDPPELTVDSNGIRLANTGALSAEHLWQGGAEAAGNWRNFYAQGGYYDFEVQRAPMAFTAFTASGTHHTAIVTPSDNSFSGWYVQASWILTGESKGYNPATGAFTPPQPAAPLVLDGSGWGAWELAGRYSVLDLNDHANNAANLITNWTGGPGGTRTYTFYNTVRGGDQKIWTAGLNWYPNNSIRFALDYQLIDINRLQAPSTVTTSASGVPPLPHLGASQTVQAISLRSQISF